MARTTNGPTTKRRHKKVLKAAKGYFGGRGRLYRSARETVARAWAFSTVHRRLKKRTFRQLWNARIWGRCLQPWEWLELFNMERHRLGV